MSKLGGAIASGYDKVMVLPDRAILRSRRQALAASLSGLILEIGAGTGLSLPHYPSKVRLVATDPNIDSLLLLRERAVGAAARTLVSAAGAGALPFAAGTFDGVVCHLALCTIPEPKRALAEVRRVLKPEAPARFMEHVRGPSRAQAWLQDLATPLWSRLAGGCRLNQDTEEIIRYSGLVVERVVFRRGLVLPLKLIWARSPA